MKEEDTMSNELGPFAKAFIAAQKATEAVKKASTNPAFRSKYADLAGVVEAVVPALNAAGIGVIQMPSFDGELVHVNTTLIHESGASMASTLSMRPTKPDPQGVGSAITYARRYALLAMTGAAPEDDDGNAASGPSKVPQRVLGDETMLVARLSAAEAKRRGEADKIKAEINACDLAGLLDWETNFGGKTAHLPLSWADPIRDMIALRREELMTPEPEGAAELDAAFRATMGGPSPSSVARPNGALV